MRMYHVSIHLSVNGHWGCFRMLAVVNSATVNIGSPVGRFPEVKLVVCMVFQC